MLDVYAGSRTPEWGTPPELFAALDREFGGFTLDVCATPENAKCARYFTAAEDGLAQPWRGTCWMNPPYGREIGRWLRKAYESSLEGATVVCLIPAKTETSWWHDYAMKGEIRFLRGRIRFQGAVSRSGSRHGSSNAPFPSAVVIFKPQQAMEAVS